MWATGFDAIDCEGTIAVDTGVVTGAFRYVKVGFTVRTKAVHNAKCEMVCLANIDVMYEDRGKERLEFSHRRCQRYWLCGWRSRRRRQ